LLVESPLVGVDHRRQPLREIGCSLGRNDQNLGSSAGDLAGLRVTPSALTVENREAVGKVRREDLGHEVGPTVSQPKRLKNSAISCSSIDESGRCRRRASSNILPAPPGV
jgi:hypothetical protein